MRVLALDYGRARTGVAVSDPSGLIARPIGAIARIDTPAGQRRLAQIIAAEEPEALVVGDPRLMSGERGAQARAVRGFVGRLQASTGLPVHLVDERLSTAGAEKRRADGAKSDTDSVAACLLVEAYLASAR